MNPMTNIKNVKKLSEQDLKLGGKTSWHDQYKNSAWIFVGGLPYGLTEGDVICVFSQYGEIVNINLVRDKDTGKHKGFCFVCYEDQRSTVLAVDNLNGIKILTRTIRVDHVQDYKVPKDSKKNPVDEEIAWIRENGCAPVVQIRPDSIKEEPKKSEKQKTVVREGPAPNDRSADDVKVKLETSKVKKEVKSKKNKNEKKSKKSKKKRSHSSSSDSSTTTSSDSDSDSDTHRRHKKRKK